MLFGDCGNCFDICSVLCVTAFVVKVIIQVFWTADAFPPFDM